MIAVGQRGLSGRAGRAPVPRREDERILRGRTRYLDDIDPPGAVHVAFVRSPFAHARIGGIEVPGGLEGVVRGDHGRRPRGPCARPPGPGRRGRRASPTEGHPVLARDEVRYSGQPWRPCWPSRVRSAEDAAELVEVDYEPLDPVLDARASEVTMSRWHKVSGDVDGAFASAAHVVRASHALPAARAGADGAARRDRLVRRGGRPAHRPGARRRTATASSPGWRTSSIGRRSRST